MHLLIYAFQRIIRGYTAFISAPYHFRPLLQFFLVRYPCYFVHSNQLQLAFIRCFHYIIFGVLWVGWWVVGRVLNIFSNTTFLPDEAFAHIQPGLHTHKEMSHAIHATLLYHKWHENFNYSPLYFFSTHPHFFSSTLHYHSLSSLPSIYFSKKAEKAVGTPHRKNFSTRKENWVWAPHKKRKNTPTHQPLAPHKQKNLFC